jgi:hypothetical protein
LIQLYQNYCLRKRCPECRIGRIVNKAKTHET